MKILTIALNTFREALRNKIAYSVLAFAACLMLVSAFFGTVTLGNQVEVIKDFGLFSLSFSAAILSTILGTTLLNKELKQKTIYNILSKPITRAQFVIGKYLGLFLTVSTLVTIMGIGLTFFVWPFEGKFDLTILQGVFYIILETAVISSLVIFFSSIVITVTLTALFTIAAYIAGHSISYLSFFLTTEYSPSHTTKIIMKSLNWIIPDLTIFNINDMIVYSESIDATQTLAAIAYALGYSILVITLSIIIFERRELN